MHIAIKGYKKVNGIEFNIKNKNNFLLKILTTNKKLV